MGEQGEKEGGAYMQFVCLHRERDGEKKTPCQATCAASQSVSSPPSLPSLSPLPSAAVKKTSPEQRQGGEDKHMSGRGESSRKEGYCRER